uniref:Uncharacterized protein n=1 Tax=Gasterosteus aculeatus aculeatus TaxID=481459 RepID=A0AAQ4P546_GASAC
MGSRIEPVAIADKSRRELGSEPHAAPAAADMITALVGWTVALVLSLLVESCRPQKLNVHWGPQSMMYLKGKHGRRFVSEDDRGVLTQGLQGWYALLRGTLKLQAPDISKRRHIVRSEKVLIHYLQER